MLRDTMISTMPVAMIAMEALCTDRFQRLRDVRKAPCDITWNPIQIRTRATTMPSNLVSISVEAITSRHDRGEDVFGVIAGGVCASVIVTLSRRDLLRDRT